MSIFRLDHARLDVAHLSTSVLHGEVPLAADFRNSSLECIDLVQELKNASREIAARFTDQTTTPEFWVAVY